MKEDKLSFTILRYSALMLLHQGMMLWKQVCDKGAEGWWWWKGSSGSSRSEGRFAVRGGQPCPLGWRWWLLWHQRYQHWCWGWRSGSSAGLLCGRGTGTMFRLSCPWGCQRSGRGAMSWRGRRAEANWRRALWPLFYPMFQYPDLWSPVSEVNKSCAQIILFLFVCCDTVRDWGTMAWGKTSWFLSQGSQFTI